MEGGGTSMMRGGLAARDAGSAVAAFGVLVLLVLWVGIAWDLGRDRDRVVLQAEADTANLARAFEEHIQRTVAGLDQTLLYLKAEFEQDPAHFTLRDPVARAAVLRDVALQLAIIDAQGNLADSNVPDFARVNLSDREHFRVHRDAADVGLFVSKPVLGRASGKWSIQLTRRLDYPDGSFAGVLVLSMDPQYLADFYGSIDVGTKGAILLIGRDGVVRAASDGSIGRELATPGMAAALFTRHAGTQHVAGPVDDHRRIASFRTLGHLPLAIWVGRSEAEVLAPHVETQRSYRLVGAAVTALLGLAVLMLYRMVRQQAVIARDLSLKKSELLVSRERLRRYVADLERIAEVAAHDMQEPLRRVVAYAQLLSNHAQSVLDAESRDYVAHVVAGAHRMRKLVRDLEAFVAVDHLPAPDHLVPAGLAMAAAAERLADDVRQAGGVLMVDALPDVAADEKTLTEIFAQLVDNALRYRAPNSRPLVHVTARREDGLAVFAVRDNGVGIEDRHLPRVFEIFHRPHVVDGRAGTGMGLATVRRMVERLGGRVWVESEVGVGSTFSFSLPMALQPEAHLPQEAHAA